MKQASVRVTPAMQSIWRVVRRIPRGSTVSYGEVARRAGLPGRARLVGYALKQAPAHLRLPWFRVTGARGRIAFPRGSKLHVEQRRRLQREGVRVQHGRALPKAVDLDALLWKL